MCIYGVLGLILAKNIEMDKCPPLITLLSTLSSLLERIPFLRMHFTAWM